MSNSEPVTIRPAGPGDAAALRLLAALDSQRVLVGDVWVAEMDGELVAAVSGAGRCVADPFRPTADVVSLLRLRAAGAQPRPRPRLLGRARRELPAASSA